MRSRNHETMKGQSDISFQEAVRGLMAGDFSRLAPLFDTPSDGSPCWVIKWYEGGLFASEPKALAEAFTLRLFQWLHTRRRVSSREGSRSQRRDQYRPERISLGGESGTVKDRGDSYPEQGSL